MLRPQGDLGLIRLQVQEPVSGSIQCGLSAPSGVAQHISAGWGSSTLAAVAGPGLSRGSGSGMGPGPLC